MKRFRALLAFAVALNFCVPSAAQESNFDVGSLSPKGRAAYQKLLSAETFRVGGVGDAGETSGEELALYDLLDERDAAEALRRLVSDGGYEGRLYGLLGLSITNVGEFNRAVEAYKSREEPPEREYDHRKVPKGRVSRQSGCMIFDEDWQKVIGDIQSGRYDRMLRRKQDE